MVGNTQEGDSTWARYIGGSYAIFVAPDRKSHQSKGFRGYTDEALNVVSNYGKIGLIIDWGGGAGGRNTRTELATKFLVDIITFQDVYKKLLVDLDQTFGKMKKLL